MCLAAINCLAQATPVRSVSSLPATCKGGSPLAQSDEVVLITLGTGQLYICSAPNTWTPSGNSGILLEHNGLANGSQSILNLQQGANITLTDDGVGGITITSSGGGGGGGTPGNPVNSLQWNSAGGFAGAADANGNIPATVDLTTGRINPCNVDNVRYASCYNWTQSPAGSLTGGVPATVTLTPGPRGIDTSASAAYPFYVYVATVGTPEAVVVTGGTCTSAGAASCTIQFTPVNSHSAGFTVQSATSGAAEAGMDGNGTNAGPAKISFRPSTTPAGNNTFAFVFYAPWFIRCGSNCVIDGDGAMAALNNTRAIMVLPTGVQVSNTIRNFRFLPESGLNTSAAITNTVCAANVATVTSTLNPTVGSMVDIQFTKNQFFWGPHIVTTTSPTTWTYTATGCSQPNEVSAGFNAYQAAAIEDNGQDNRFENLYISFGAAPYAGNWANGIVILNDQHVIIDHLVHDGHGTCNATYCGSMIYAPGNFSTGPAVLEVSNTGIYPGCSGNGVTAYNGNTASFRDTIIQGYNMWGYWGGDQRGGFGGVNFDNTYEEVGACTNNFYTPNQQAGAGQYGQALTWIGGEGAFGTMPTFASGGATTYYYYLVVKDSVLGPSAPLYIGKALPSGTAVTVNWPRAQDVTAASVAITPTYDLLRVATSTDAPSTGNCAGGTTAACGSVTTAQAQCAGTSLQCTFTDDVSVATTSYAVVMPEYAGATAGATLVPIFLFFPGHFVLQNNANLTYLGGATQASNIAASGGISAINGLGPVMTDGPNQTPNSYIRSFSSKMATSNASSIFKIFEPLGSVAANAPGIITLLNPYPGNSAHTIGNGAYAITLATPNGPQLSAASSPRTKTASANDSGIGFDVAGNNPALYSTGYASPVGHAFYVGSLLDGTSWKQRITTSNNEFNSPTQFDGLMSSILSCTGCGPFVRSAATTDNFPGSSLSGNWTTVEGSFTVTSGKVTPATFAGGGDQKAWAYYNAVTPANDVFAAFRSYHNGSSTNMAAVCVRATTTVPVSAYCAGPQTSGTSNLNLMKFNGVAGFTSLCSTTHPADGTWVGISAIGSTITLYMNGAEVCHVTDTAFTSGSVGLGGSNAASGQGVSNLNFFNAGWSETEGLTLTSLAPVTLTDAATITWAVGGFSLVNATVTLGGNRTLNVTGLASGGNYTLRVVQDATPPRTLTLGTGCTWKVANGGAGAITLTNAANAIDILSFSYDGTNCYARVDLNFN